MSSPGRPEPPPDDAGASRSDAEEEAQRRAERRRLLAERVRSNPQLLVGAGLLLGFLVVAVLAVVSFGASLTVEPSSVAIAESLHPPGPSWSHPFGTMSGLGVDVMDSLFRAVPVDLALVGGIIAIGASVGLLVGAAAGLGSRWTDLAVTTVADIVVGVPPFFLVMVMFLGVQLFLGPAHYLLGFGLLFAAVLWPYYARPVRARAQQVAQEAYVDAARAAGATPGRLLARHVIPNALGPVLAQVPVDLYNIFFVLTAFPFIGCYGGGAGGFFATLSPLPSPYYPEWGNLLALGACHGWSPLAAVNFWWMYAFPAATIVLFGVAVALVCDGADRLLRGSLAA